MTTNSSHVAKVTEVVLGMDEHFDQIENAFCYGEYLSRPHCLCCVNTCGQNRFVTTLLIDVE